ncbi:MAG: hypothetical protein MSA79_03355 [Campylobacter sp.]|nr:hypothetical protein [Campylobacter sp.]
MLRTRWVVFFTLKALRSPAAYAKYFCRFPAAVALIQRIAKQKNSAKIFANATAAALRAKITQKSWSLFYNM